MARQAKIEVVGRMFGVILAAFLFGASWAADERTRPTFPETTARLVSRWNRQTRLNDVLTAPMEWIFGLQAARPRLFTGLTAGRVLEIGAGTGRNIRHYPRRPLIVASDRTCGRKASWAGSSIGWTRSRSV